MTDNLKQRIAEAIRNAEYTQEAYEDVAQAVLDIVEPMLPKWMPIDVAPKEYSGEMYGWCYGTSPRRIHWAHERWTYSDSCMPVTVATHCFLMQPTPERE